MPGAVACLPDRYPQSGAARRYSRKERMSVTARLKAAAWSSDQARTDQTQPAQSGYVLEVTTPAGVCQPAALSLVRTPCWGKAGIWRAEQASNTLSRHTLPWQQERPVTGKRNIYGVCP
jgi:hypothetical protein